MRRVLALARWVVAFEVSLYRSLFRWVARRPAVPDGAVPFAYVGAVSVLLWAFIVVSTVELVVLHVILPWETVRLVADIIGIWGLVWMLGFAASYNVYPHLVDGPGLRVRNGTHTDVTVPWAAIESVGTRERSWEASKAVQVVVEGEASVLGVLMASRTNVDVRLRRPLVVPLRKGEVTVTEVRVYADDARGLANAARDHLTKRPTPRR